MEENIGIRWGLILSDVHISWDDFSRKEKIIYNIIGILKVIGVIIFPLLGLIWAIGVLGLLLNWW